MKPQQLTNRKQVPHPQTSKRRKSALSTASTTAVASTDLSWVRVRGIGLYALWSKQHIPPDTLPVHPEIWSRHTQIDLWPVTQLQWLPATSEENAWIAADRIEEIVKLLREHLSIIVRQNNGTTQGVGAQPAYLIFHIEEMETQLPPSIRKNIRHSQRTWRGAKDGEQAAQIGAQEEILDALQLHLNIGQVDQRTGWSPSRFSHYDRAESRRGWVILSPTLAVIAKLSTQQVNNLVALLQPRDTDSTGNGAGILPQHYEAVYERVMQWNAAHDIFETVVQLEKIVESGQKSTDGQLWLNFALAAIGVLLAFFAGPSLNIREISALLCLSTASVMHALYARNGTTIYQRIGWLFFATAIIIALTLLFWHQ